MKESPIKSHNSRRLVWLRICIFISLTWTVVLGGFVFIIGQSDLRYHIKNAFAPSKEALLAEWATAKIELMKEEFGHTQETLSDFRLRMYGDSTDMIIVNPIMNNIPWPSQNLRSLLDREYEDEISQAGSPPKKKGHFEPISDYQAKIERLRKLEEIKRLKDMEPWEEYQKQSAKPIEQGSWRDRSILIEQSGQTFWNIYDLTEAGIAANSEQRSLVISQKPVSRWLDLAKQDEAIDNKYKLRLEETTYEADRTRSIQGIQGIIALWLLPICGIFCSFFALGAILPWFSHTNRIIRVRRRLALTASIMWIGLMVPISIVWNRIDKLPSGVNDWNWSRGDELSSEVLAAAFLFPVALIWLFYFLWSWTLRE